MAASVVLPHMSLTTPGREPSPNSHNEGSAAPASKIEL